MFLDCHSNCLQLGPLAKSRCLFSNSSHWTVQQTQPAQMLLQRFLMCPNFVLMHWQHVTWPSLALQEKLQLSAAAAVAAAAAAVHMLASLPLQQPVHQKQPPLLAKPLAVSFPCS